MAEPWVRVHANLSGKPVVWRAVEQLGVSKHEAMGLLVEFWGAVSQHVTRGVVGTVPDAQLEAWAGWRGKRGRFAEFIRAHHLDRDGRVNEWDDYAGKLEERKERDRKRKRNSSGIPAEFQRKDDGIPETFRADSVPTIRNDTKQSVSRPALDAESKLSARLETDADRDALTAVLFRAPNRLAWCAELSAMLEGMAGHIPATATQLGEALRDFVANGGAGDPNIRYFKSYVDRIVNAPEKRTPSTPRAVEGAGHASHLVATIRGLIRESRQPGQSTNRFIVKADVATLGQDVLKAYEAVGGRDRFVDVSGDQMSFLIRDFNSALEAARAVA